MASAERELALLRFLSELNTRLEGTRNAEDALRFTLRASHDFFAASGACFSVLAPDRRTAEPRFVLPRGERWHQDLVAAFIRGERPAVPANIILAPVRRRSRAWAAFGLRRSDREFELGDGHDFSRVTAALSELIHRIDRERIVGVRARIDRKIMEELHPKDLFYQILHGLRSLTNYDHSSALLIGEEEGESLELVAEQIAHTKGKSLRIGLRLPLTPELQGLIAVGTVYGFERDRDAWRQWTGEDDATPLARLLDTGPAPVREESMLCAPLPARDGTLGVLKVAACHGGNLGQHEAELLERFVPQASIAIQNLQRTESLRRKIVAAERKLAVADLARGVSHDVNNALGSVLPLVQQLLADARSGTIEPAVAAKDLEQIEQSMKVCQRIFGGMLAVARGTARKVGQADVRRAIEATLDILGDGMRRRGVRVHLEIPAGLPPIRGSQGDLEQILLNLVSNARDAMPGGGDLTIRASGTADGEMLEVGIRDTGYGIPPENMARVQEPFFTTKRRGTGLGLTICRSIIWELGGRLSMMSEVGSGTTVTVLLPVIDQGSSDQAAGRLVDQHMDGGSHLRGEGQA